MTTDFRRSTTLAAILLAALAFTVPGATSARAGRCQDIAQELKEQVDGVKIGITTGKIIYLSHPHARELSLGCRGANYSNELYAKADRRKPKPEFFQLVASAVPSYSPSRSPTCCAVRPAVSIEWGCCAATPSRCASAGSTWNARAPGRRLRSRSPAARTSSRAAAGGIVSDLPTRSIAS